MLANTKIEIFEDLKKHYVRMAFETNKYASTAKSHLQSAIRKTIWKRN